MIPNLLQQSDRPRIAASLGNVFPNPGDSAVCAWLDRLANALGAELRVLHRLMPDPRQLPDDLRARIGSGFCIPFDANIGRNDAHHARSTQPERLASLTAVLDDARLPLDTDDIVATACSYARWIRAWHSDLVYVDGIRPQSLHMGFAARLLNLPLVLRIRTIPSQPQHQAITPLLVTAADLIVAANETIATALRDTFGHGIEGKTVAPSLRASGACPEVPQLRRLIQRPRPADALPSGPEHAFRNANPAPRAWVADAPRPFVVVGQERTGSSMIVGMIATHPRATCAGELFNPGNIARDHLHWLHKADDDHAELVVLRQQDPALLIDRLGESATRLRCNDVGFKLLYYHSAIDDRIIDRLTSLPDLRVVHLLRRDRLRRWLSHCRATATHSWYTAKRDSSKPAARPPCVELDIPKTLRDFANGELMELRHSAVFAPEQPQLELYYEDFTRDTVKTSRQISEFFGLPFRKLPVRSAKTGTAPLQESISNLDEVRQALAVTRWRGLLDHD